MADDTLLYMACPDWGGGAPMKTNCDHEFRKGRADELGYIRDGDTLRKYRCCLRCNHIEQRTKSPGHDSGWIAYIP